MKKTLITITLASNASIAFGASSLVDPLTGYTGTSQDQRPGQPTTLASGGLNVDWVWPGGPGAWETITFDGSGTTFGSLTPTGNNDTTGRNYLRTNETDYHTVGFTAYITINRTARESVFFGLGTGSRGGGNAPDIDSGAASVYFDLQDNFNNGSARILGGTPGAPTNSEQSFTPLDNVTGLMRLRMIFDPTGQTVDYAIDYDPSGAFTADQTFPQVDVSSIAGEWTSGDAASIYFGAQGYVDEEEGTRQGLTFTDFQVDVVPEPSTGLLALIGLAATLRRKRS